MNSDRSEFSIVSVQPDRVHGIDSRVLARILENQDGVSENWKGVDITYTGKPGFADTDFLNQLEKRTNEILATLNKDNISRHSVIKFTLNTDTSLPTTMVFNIPKYRDGTDLLFRLNKTDNQLLRNILEMNNLNLTESHNWNLL